MLIFENGFDEGGPPLVPVLHGENWDDSTKVGRMAVSPLKSCGADDFAILEVFKLSCKQFYYQERRNIVVMEKQIPNVGLRLRPGCLSRYGA